MLIIIEYAVQFHTGNYTQTVYLMTFICWFSGHFGSDMGHSHTWQYSRQDWYDSFQPNVQHLVSRTAEVKCPSFMRKAGFPFLFLWAGLYLYIDMIFRDHLEVWSVERVRKSSRNAACFTGISSSVTIRKHKHLPYLAWIVSVLLNWTKSES